MKKILLVFFLTLTFSISFSWLPGFNYRIPITIKENSGEDLIDYQILVTLNTQSLISQGKMRSDCGDIRFTDENNNLLNYWLESGCNTQNTRIWVKVNIPASSTKTIYLYYGNPSATSLSNSTAVFGKNIASYYVRDNYYIAFILANKEWISGGTNLGIYGDDRGASRTLPSPRIIYGTTVSTIYLSTNGLLRWDNVADTRYSNFLDTNNKILTAHWDDLYIDTSYRSDAGIYEIIGSDSLGNYIAYRWATTYYSSRSTPADFEILLYDKGYIQFNVYMVWTDATPNEFISRGDESNYIDLTPRWQYIESVLFVPRSYPEPTISLGNEETLLSQNPIWLYYNSSKTQVFVGENVIFSSLWQATQGYPQPSNWLSGFNYRIPITIKENSGKNLIDYQILVTLNTQSLISQGKMRNDCGDIRFTDSDGITLLNYWIESGCNTQNTRIWVKVNIPASSTKTIYLYYGNPSANSLSNPDTTMFIYENFTIAPRGSIAGSASYDSTNKWIQLTPNTGNQLGYLYYTKVSTNPIGFYAKFYFWAGGGNGADAIWLGVYDSSYSNTREDIVNGGYHFTYDEYQDRICFTKNTTDNGAGIACTSETTIDSSQWHLAEIYFWYNGSACTRIFYDGNLKVFACDINVQSNVINGVGQIIFGGRTGGLYNYHRIGNGLLYIVKYTYPEPTISLGNEESYFQQNVYLSHFIFSWNASGVWINETYKFSTISNGLSGFNYRIPITIKENSGENLIDYQILVTLNTQSLISQGKMRNDCGDIRFTDSDGITLLNYWIESGCNTQNTRIWVKVNIPASSTKTIYLYYGNPSATSLSNAANTFDYFFSFEGSFEGWTPSKYETRTTYATNDPTITTEWKYDGSYSVKLRIGDDYSDEGAYSQINRTFSFSTNVKLDFAYKLYAEPSDFDGGYARFTVLVDGNVVYDSGPFGGYGYDSRTLFNSLSIPSGLHTIVFKLIEDSSPEGWTYERDAYIDRVSIRKYASPEPTISLGNEESSNPFRAWANVTKIIDTTGRICWRFYANNSLNLWNTTPISCIDSISSEHYFEINLLEPPEGKIVELAIGDYLDTRAQIKMKSNYNFCVNAKVTVRYNTSSNYPDTAIPSTNSIYSTNNPQIIQICTGDTKIVTFDLYASKPTVKAIDIVVESFYTINDTKEFFVKVLLIANKELKLKKGWNLISIPYKEFYFDLSRDECNLREKVFHYFNGKNWEYRTYRELTYGKSYWVYSDKNCTIYLAASKDAELNDLPKSSGKYNMIGSLTRKISASTVANKIGCNNAIVRYYDPEIGFITVSTIEPWKGYIFECS